MTTFKSLSKNSPTAKTGKDEEELEKLLERNGDHVPSNQIKEMDGNEQSIFSMTGFTLFLTTVASVYH